MTSSSFDYISFPHTMLSETMFRHLSILLPHISLLQIVRPAAVPDWGREQFLSRPVVRDEGLLGKMRATLRGFQEAAALNGVSGILASIAGDWGRSAQAQESRFGIQSRLRGKMPEPPDRRESLLMEAAIFLELARDLDEREIDLATSLSQIDGLEDRFREIFEGAESSEMETEEELGIKDIPLTSDRTFLSYMLPRRIAFWYRLFFLQAPKNPVIPVAMVPEVAEELLDPVRASLGGEGLRGTSVPLISIPSLERLERDAFLSLRTELRKAEMLLEGYWQEVERVLGDPAGSSPENDLVPGAKAIEQYIEDFCGKSNAPGKQRVELKLLRFDNLTHDGFWKQLDRAGYEVLGGAARSTQPAPFILVLE